MNIFYDISEVEKSWEETRKLHFAYLPYNRAMLLMTLGQFREAQEEFKKFLARFPSLKTKCIYSLILLSGIAKYDFIKPATMLLGVKEKFKKMFQ